MSRSTAVSAAPPVAPGSTDVPVLYRAARPPLRALAARFFDFSVDGTAHLPAQGPYIVAANHHNYLDGVVLALAVPVGVSFLVMPRVFRATPLHPTFHRLIGSIELKLNGSDVGGLRRALAALSAGRVVGIFPEGPFSVRGRLEAGLPGVALLAMRSGVPVVPAGIRGTYEALVGRHCYVPRRHPLGVRFGAPRRFSAEGAGDRAARERVTALIMGDIAALLS
ncbi:MAG: 1-acyl-sn-glycerol-3-phosphate acyltransferase [Candidatus Rokubacteria bacterium]|nr:1-acyl-sn-glycerol-3-phosphate acyltransferase [Candidatus Rokubacteria bacterium]